MRWVAHIRDSSWCLCAFSLAIRSWPAWHWYCAVGKAWAYRHAHGSFAQSLRVSQTDLVPVKSVVER